MPSINIFPHGNCCGAAILDGFWDKDTKISSLMSGGYGRADAERHAANLPVKSVLIEELRTALRVGCAYKGIVMVVLNQDQFPHWDETLKSFGFVVVDSDVSNPNHSTNPDSRLVSYIRVQRRFAGDRTAAGLSATVPGIVPIPQPPPPPPAPPVAQVYRDTMARAGRVTWGRPL